MSATFSTPFYATLITALFIVGLSLLGATLTAAAAARAARLLDERRLLGTRTSALLGFLPALVGIAVALAFILPTLTSSCHCAFHDPHHPHLCLTHPTMSSLLVTGALGASIGLLMLGRRASRLGREFILSHRWARDIQREAALEEVDGVLLHRVSSLGTAAATVGTIHPTVVVDDRVWRELSSNERRAIALHEQAHVVRRDGLMLFMLRLSLLGVPVRLGDALIATWSRSVELASDAHAKIILGDGALVAETLVTCSRMAAGSPLALAFGASLEPELSRRVTTLLDDGAHFTRATGDVGAVMVALASALAIGSWLTAHETHHAIETAIGWLS